MLYLMGVSWGSPESGTIISKGSLDATLAANLPSNKSNGDIYDISVAGSFENDALILPASAYFSVPDQIRWNGINWVKMEAGDNISDAAFDAAWDGNVNNAPSKNAVYDVLNPIKTKSEQQDATKTVSTNTYTFLDLDHGKTIFFDYAGAVTITCPDSLLSTVHVTCVAEGAATTLAFVAGGTATFVSKDSKTTVTARYGVATLVHKGGNAWFGFGNLE
jgi:hypothetical protein